MSLNAAGAAAAAALQSAVTLSRSAAAAAAREYDCRRASWLLAESRSAAVVAIAKLNGMALQLQQLGGSVATAVWPTGRRRLVLQLLPSVTLPGATACAPKHAK